MEHEETNKNQNGVASESEVLKTVELVVNYLAPRFTFGYYEVEDIKQEARIIALEAVKDYDSQKGASLRTFLHTHVRNRLYNFKRDNFQRPIPHDASDKKRESMLKLNEIKKNLVGCSPGENSQGIKVERLVEETPPNDFPLLDFINKRLSIEFMADYQAFLEGSPIPKHRRLSLIKQLKELHKEYEEENGEEG